MIRRRDLLVLGGMGAGVSALLGRLLFVGEAASPLCEDDIVCQERRQQQSLPKSGDPVWPKLKRCRVSLDKASGDYTLIPTPEVLDMAGQHVRVGGFVVPLDGSDQTQDFLIGANTPVCFYHPPGDPNALMEVNAVAPVTWNDRPTTIVGTFTLIQNTRMGVFFKLVGARPA